MTQLVGGETAFQLNAMELEDEAFAAKPAGAGGIVAHDPAAVLAWTCVDGADAPNASAASTT